MRNFKIIIIILLFLQIYCKYPSNLLKGFDILPHPLGLFNIN